jgi:adenine-specific DNA-methyltransferase
MTRSEDVRAADSVPYRLLEAQPELEGGNGDAANMLIQGDNLDALKALLPYYAGRVKCIYIDPPYNTGSAFEHYDDNLAHSQWLAMIYPRLRFLRDLLSKDGSIWISIDEDEHAYLRVLCDEIFDRRNFIATMVWQKRYAPDSRTAISDAHEYILCYAMDPKSFKATRNLLEVGEDQARQFRNPDNDPRGVWKARDFTAPGFRPNQMYKVTLPSGRVVEPPAGRCWRVTKEGFERFEAEKRMYYGPRGDGVPAVKRFLSELTGMVPWTWWTHSEVGHSQEAKRENQILFGGSDTFGTPKPERLMRRIIHIATNPGDIVLDSFLGSGTTAAVAHKMSRQWIGIEMGEHAITHCKPRLDKVIAGEQGGVSEALNWSGGGGYRFYRLGEPVFDADGGIAADIRFPTLAAHVWFSETATPYEGDGSSPLLGIHEATAYALLYNGILGDRSVTGGNVLTSALLDRLRSDADGWSGPMVVYGEASRLGAARLKDAGVTFKQTPYDVRAR